MPDENTPLPMLPGHDVLRYGESDLQLIHRFLAVCMTHAQTALERCTPDDPALLTHHMIKGQMQYWRNVIAAAKWFAALACKRQFHLGIADDIILEEQVAQWNRLSQT